MSELPKGWTAAELGEIASVDWGNTSITKKFYVDSGYVAYSASGPDGYLSHFENEGDAIVLSAIGAGCGKCFRASGRWTAIKNTITIKPQPEISNGFLFRFLNNPKNWEISGSGQPFITLGSGRRNNIPLPPAAEQTRIAAKLDELLAQVDTLKARIDGIPALLKRFRQSVLAAAVSGRLTEEWRVTRTLEQGWQKVILSDIAEVKGGITKDSKKQSLADEEVPYLRVANVQRGFIDLSEVKRIRVPTSRLNELLLAPGDILFNEGGDLDKLGRGWIWEGQIQRCSFQNHVFRARLFDKKNQPKYISWWGNSLGLEYFIKSGKQTTNLASINKTVLSNLPLLLPPPEEQTEIVRRVEQLFAFADQLEAKVASAKSRIDHLTQSILAKAFRGELVPQDPNDEPASVLLERIKAQRAAAPKAKRGRKASV